MLNGGALKLSIEVKQFILKNKVTLQQLASLDFGSFYYNPS